MKFWQLSSITSRIVMITVCISMLATRPIGDDKPNKANKVRNNKLTPQDPTIQ
jgi:hypothetical protein